jgi:hypothetical protein
VVDKWNKSMDFWWKVAHRENRRNQKEPVSRLLRRQGGRNAY